MSGKSILPSSQMPLGYEPKPTSKSLNTGSTSTPNTKQATFLSLVKGMGVAPPRFDGQTKNFLNWSRQMDVFFRELDLVEIVNATSVDEVSGTIHGLEKDRLLADMLLFSVEPQLVGLIADLHSGLEMWQKINAEFNRQDGSSVFRTLVSLITYKSQGIGMAGHCDEFISIVRTLVSQGVHLPTDALACFLLHSFPPKYGPLVTMLLGKLDGTLTLESIKAHAINAENQFKSVGQKATDAVFVSQKKWMGPKYPSQKGFFKGPNSRFPNRTANFNKPTCSRCGKPGHVASKCYTKQPEFVAVAQVDQDRTIKKTKLYQEAGTQVIDEVEKLNKKQHFHGSVAEKSVTVTIENGIRHFQCHGGGLKKLRKGDHMTHDAKAGVGNQPNLQEEATNGPSPCMESKTPASLGIEPETSPKIQAKVKIKTPEIITSAIEAEVERDIEKELEERKILSNEQLVEESVNHVTESTNKMNIDDYSFVVDSGASSHMVWNQKILHSMVPANCNISQAENGRDLNGTAIGEVSCQHKCGQNSTILHLKDVILVPALRMNILSVAKLVAHHHRVQFTKSNCTITTKSGHFVAQADKENGLYILHVSIKTFEEEALVVSTTESQLQLWHNRLGHVNEGTLQAMFQNDSKIKLESGPLNCTSCIKGKYARAPFTSSESKSKKIFELVHSDVCGPLEVEGISGYRYFVTFIDDKSRYAFIYLLRHKSEVFDKFKEYSAHVKNMFETPVKILRSDNGGEYISEAFREYLKMTGISHQTTVPYSPQQNGVAERMNRTLMDTTRSMLYTAQLPARYWTFGVMSAAYVRNRTWVKYLKKKSPYEELFGKIPNLETLKVFGCLCWVQVPAEKRRKLDPRAVKCIFLGYSTSSKAYIVQNLDSKRIYTSRDVKFFEHLFIPWSQTSCEGDNTISNENDMSSTSDSSGCKTQGELELLPINTSESTPTLSETDSEILISPMQQTSLSEGENSDISLSDSEDEQYNGDRDWLGSRYIMQPANIPPQRDLNAPPRDAKRKSHYRKDDSEVALVLIPGPDTYHEALNSDDATEWLKAMKEEISSLNKNDTWSLVPLPPGRKPVGCRWTLGIKRDAEGALERYKARLCAKGFSQREGIDYNETFSPVVQFNSIRVVLTIASLFKMDVQQMDVKTAFFKWRTRRRNIHETTSRF